MDKAESMRRLSAAKPRELPPFPQGLSKRRSRDYQEWTTLRRWGKLPEWEETAPGYLLREARENAGLSQRRLAERLGTSQQAVSQAEAWEANPTVAFMRRWVGACGGTLEMVVSRTR